MINAQGMSSQRHPLTHDLTLDDPTPLEPLDASALVTDWASILDAETYAAWCTHVGDFISAVAEIRARDARKGGAK